MSIDPKLEYTPEDDEAWLLFLKKFENLKLPPTPITRKGNLGEENRKKWDSFQSDDVVKNIIGE